MASNDEFEMPTGESVAGDTKRTDNTGNQQWWWEGQTDLQTRARRLMYAWCLHKQRNSYLLTPSSETELQSKSSDELLTLMRHNDIIFIAASAAVLAFTSAMSALLMRTILETTQMEAELSLSLILTQLLAFFPALMMLALLSVQAYRNYLQREYRLLILHCKYKISSPIVDLRVNMYSAALLVFGFGVLLWFLLGVSVMFG